MTDDAPGAKAKAPLSNDVMNRATTWIAAALFSSLSLALATTGFSDVSPSVKCEALKLKAVGKYERCRFKVQAVAVMENLAPDFGGCAAQFAANWAKAERRGNGECPTQGDRLGISQTVEAHVNAISIALAGPGGGGVCGNGIIEGSEQCDRANLGNADCTSLGFLLGSLGCSATCTFDTSGCTPIGCDPLAQDCGTGQGCYPFLGCQSAGTKGAGTVCILPNECRPGLTCAEVSTGTFQCAPLCDVNDPSCPTGTSCLSATLPAYPGLGICQP